MALFAAANLIFLTVTVIRLDLFLTPCRLEADCRGCGVDTKWLKQWEEQERNTGQAILQMVDGRSEKERKFWQSVPAEERRHSLWEYMAAWNRYFWRIFCQEPGV